METIGIKTTIYDFFSYFIPGVILNNCIILAIYFTSYSFDIPFIEIFGEELLSRMPNWFLILTVILVTYVIGIILSTLSSIVIEKIIVKKIKFLKKYITINNIVSEDLYNLFQIKIKKDYDIDFNDKHMRLIISFVEKYSANAYNTAFVFLTIYGMNRNLSLIFFSVGITTLILNIIQHNNIFFAIVLIILSVLTFIGYIRFFRYFISQILSAYLNK